jgi:hypothetical protein
VIDGAAGALRRQARLVGQMLKDMLDAFARMDAALARDVITRDVEVDDMTNALFREFITHMMEDPRNITPCLHYVFIAKNIERMGDLVTHGAEHVIFVTEGKLAEARVKGHSTATIEPPKGVIPCQMPTATAGPDVDDEPAQLALLSYNLKAAGFRVVTAKDGEEAVLAVAEQGPDVILLDWMLPRLSGLEACRQIKATPRGANRR